MDEQDKIIRHVLNELALPHDVKHVEWMRSVAAKADWRPIRTLNYAKQELGLER